MKNNRLVIIVVIASLMLACSVANLTTPATPIVVVVTQLVTADTPIPQPTATQAPTALPSEIPATPTLVSTPTASIPMVTPLKDPVNCRFGPSVNFQQVAALKVGEFAQVTGKSSDGGWLQVLSPNGSIQNCWVAASVVITSGDLSGIMPVSAPAAFITNVNFQVKPNSTNLGPGCVGPFPTFSLKGTIFVNGPLSVEWHIETQQDGNLSEHTLGFSQFGSQDISVDYVPSVWKKGSFWVRLVISASQSMVKEATYQVDCK